MKKKERKEKEVKKTRLMDRAEEKEKKYRKVLTDYTKAHVTSKPTCLLQ